MSLPFASYNGSELSGRCAGSVIVMQANLQSASNQIGSHSIITENNSSEASFEGAVNNAGRHVLDDADIGNSYFYIGLTYRVN